MSSNYGHNPEKAHYTERKINTNPPPAPPPVHPVWVEKSRNGLYLGECVIYGVKIRLQKMSRGWECTLWIAGERPIKSFSSTAKEAALMTAWNSFSAENARTEFGISHKLDWGDFRYSEPAPSKPRKAKTLPKYQPKIDRAANPHRILKLHDLFFTK